MKKAENYRQSLSVKVSKPEAYNALVYHIPDWWSTIDGSPDKVGTEFKVSFGAESYWTFKLVSLDELCKVVWKCIEYLRTIILKALIMNG